LTRIHQLHYLTLPKANGEVSELLAVSTEEGRILFFDTNSGGSFKPGLKTEEKCAPTVQALGQLGGPGEGIVSRIKDFEILKLGESREYLIVVAGSSDGTIRLWALDGTTFATVAKSMDGGFNPNSVSTEAMAGLPSPSQLGRLIGTYETGNRITCLKAFVMSHMMEMEVNTTSDEDLENAINGDHSGSHGS
jgi:protein MAK11